MNRAARVMDAGHGGQIVVSDTFAEATTDLRGVAMLSLGSHRLKGIPNAMELHQVFHEGLRADFPTLRTFDGLPNNLPHPLSRFIGRKDDTERLRSMLGAARLVTVVGAGGSGKTRLALHVGGEMLETFIDGVWFVDLAGLGEPELVAPTVALALRIADQPGRGWIESIIRFVGSREMLLVIDNCEHLLDAVADVVDHVLVASPRSRILATSREALNLPGERTWPIGSLSIPEPGEVTDEQAGGSESVALFLDRAEALQPGFAPGPDELAAIAEICRRLDGMPLAIELAAANVRGLPVGEISARLDDRFRLLVGGSRTALARQRTLEATVAWSFQLLDTDQQRLFDQLSVFAGSFALSAAERVCDGLGVDVLGGIVGLLDKSLLENVQGGSEGRYRMLETMRMFGRDRLVDAGAMSDVRDVLVDWAVGLAADAAVQLTGPDQLHWLSVLGAEIDNLRAAMRWSIEDGRLDEALAIAGSLHRYWFDRSAREGHSWLTRILGSLKATDSVHSGTRGQAHIALGHMLQLTGDDGEALAQLDQATTCFQEAGDLAGHAWALHYRGRALWGLDQLDDALEAQTQANEEFMQAGDPIGQMLSLMFIGGLNSGRERSADALALMPQLDLFASEVASPALVAHADECGFWWHAEAGSVVNGRDRLHRALSEYRKMGQHPCVAHALENSAYFASEVGESESAVLLHVAALISGPRPPSS